MSHWPRVEFILERARTKFRGWQYTTTAEVSTPKMMELIELALAQGKLLDWYRNIQSSDALYGDAFPVELAEAVDNAMRRM